MSRGVVIIGYWLGEVRLGKFNDILGEKDSRVLTLWAYREILRM